MNIKSDDTFKRAYLKVSANFPGIVENRLHEVIKNSSISEIVDYIEVNAKRFALVNEDRFDRKLMRFCLKNPDNRNDAIKILLGCYIYDKFGEQFMKDHLVTSSIMIQARDDRWLFALTSLSSQIVNGNHVYYTVNSPEISIEEKPYRVVYTRHLIDRIHQRVRNNTWAYTSLTDTFAFVYYYRYFEQTQLLDGTHALIMYEPCFEWSLSYNMVTAVFGNRYHPGEPYFFKIGYLPIELTKGFAIAKTLLPPGYALTPEYEVLKQYENVEWLKRATENHRDPDTITFDPVLIKKMHESGVPQVKIIEQAVFDYTLYNKPHRDR